MVTRHFFRKTKCQTTNMAHIITYHPGNQQSRGAVWTHWSSRELTHCSLPHIGLLDAQQESSSVLRAPAPLLSARSTVSEATNVNRTLHSSPSCCRGASPRAVTSVSCEVTDLVIPTGPSADGVCVYMLRYSAMSSATSSNASLRLSIPPLASINLLLSVVAASAIMKGLVFS